MLVMNLENSLKINSFGKVCPVRAIARDNSVAESFFKTLKIEMIYHTEYQTISKAKIAIFDYIESWCNRKRRHPTLGYKTPVQREAELQRKQAA